MTAAKTHASEGKRTRGRSDRFSRRRRGVHLAVTAVLIAAGWVGLVGNTHPHELIVDAGVVVLLTLFAANLFRFQWLKLRFHARDVAACWRVPGYMLSRCWEITVILFRDLFLHRRAGSYYRACSFQISRRNPVKLARGVLAIVYTTMAPNFIVIGIDADQKQMLFHQIERTSVSRMTQVLGAQDGAAS